MDSQKQHELISALKELALQLGRTPTVREFFASGRGYESKSRRLFGGYSPLVAAAGLEPNLPGAVKKITNAVFEVSIEKHLEAYVPRDTVAVAEPLLRGLFLGDIHFPFSNDKLIEKAIRFAEKEQPAIICQGGDLYDFISYSRFPRSHNIFTPREEQELARKKAEAMWAELRRVCPNARCVQLWGNHDVRPLKRALEIFPEAEDWVNQMLRKMMSFEGVETVEDYRQELLLPGNVMVHHGYMSQLGKHRDYTHMNAVVFHTHIGGVVFKQIQDQVLWELNGGYLSDPHSKGLSYTPQRITGWTPGWGWTDEYGPRFIPG